MAGHTQFLQGRPQSLRRQAHDVAVTAFDALDDRVAVFLRGVRASFVERIDFAQILVDLITGQRPHPDPRRVGKDDFHLERTVDQTDRGNDFVLSADQLPEHRHRFRAIARFAEESSIEHHDRIGPEDDRLRMPAGYGPRFALRVLHRQHIGRGSRRRFFDTLGVDDGEPQAHLPQQLLPPRGSAGENDLRFVCRHKLDYRERRSMRSEAVKVEHLYVHIPFCVAKCNYCAFYSEARSAAKMGDYVDAVLEELKVVCGDNGTLAEILTAAGDEPGQQSVDLEPATVFFGGGTPSILPACLMRRLLEGACTLGHLSAVSEWTIECNPSTVSVEKAKLFREFGVNRISMGVQALDDDLLRIIGRVHSAKAAMESCEKLRTAGFENINLDLMFGLPGQTLAHFRNTLERAIALQPEHISIYCLILEEDTGFWSLFQKGLLKPNEEQELAMYEFAIERLTAAGYHHYEISNFARPGRECAHNIAYWEGKDYLGLGPSACSTVGARRWQNVPDTGRYIEAIRRRAIRDRFCRSAHACSSRGGARRVRHANDRRGAGRVGARSLGQTDCRTTLGRARPVAQRSSPAHPPGYPLRRRGRCGICVMEDLPRAVFAVRSKGRPRPPSQ